MASKKNGSGELVFPNELNKIVDKVLAYKPPPKSKAAKKRAEQEKIVDIYKNKKAAD